MFDFLHQWLFRCNHSYHSSLPIKKKRLVFLWVLLACDVGTGVSRLNGRRLQRSETTSMIREKTTSTSRNKRVSEYCPAIDSKICPTRRQNRKPIKPTEGKGRKNPLKTKTNKRIWKLTKTKKNSWGIWDSSWIESFSLFCSLYSWLIFWFRCLK